MMRADLCPYCEQSPCVVEQMKSLEYREKLMKLPPLIREAARIVSRIQSESGERVRELPNWSEL